MENPSENSVRGSQKISRDLLVHRDRLLAFIQALVRDWTAAEDLFQEVSLVILKKAHGHEEIRNFGAWSREIARRKILEHWRANKKSARILSEESLQNIEASFAKHDDQGKEKRAEDRQKLNSCLAQLPDHMRQIVEMHYKNSLSLAEIGRQLRRTAGAVQVALSRIRARLLDCTRRNREGWEASSS